MMRLEELGKTVAAIQDEDRAAMRITERASESFIRELRKRSRAPRRTQWIAAAAAAVLLIGGGTAILHRRLPPGVEIARMSDVVVGKPVVAPLDRTLPLRFADGSMVELNTGSSANVLAITKDGATVELQSGKADISVVHRDSTRWMLHAGPYRVKVTGTKFSLEWLPSRNHMELALRDGAVVVTSERASFAAVALRAGERLVVDGGEWHLDSMSREAPTEVRSPSSAEVAPPVEPNAPPQEPRAVSTARTVASTSLEPRSAPVVEWQRLAEQGNYPAAYRSAETLGIPTLASSASAPTLLALAEVCRFAGHASESMVVMTKLRQRYPGTNEAAIAAFQLGRLSSNGQLAASWFRSYLKERPNGELAREASGRLIEALDRAGDRAGARAAADGYLSRYPSGPHAAFARKLIAP
ncbi:MAG: FecR family protein [Polyangiaceae bacterium]